MAVGKIRRNRTDHNKMERFVSLLKNSRNIPVRAYRWRMSPFHNVRFIQPKTNNHNIRRRKKAVELISFFSNRCMMTPNPYPNSRENNVMNLFSIKTSCTSRRIWSKAVACALMMAWGTLFVSIPERFPCKTPKRAKPRRTSTITVRSSCCMGSWFVKLFVDGNRF